jgi:predicted amidohydrolase YtcJ
VFSKDLMTIAEDQIPSTKILYTIVGGKVQFDGSAGGGPTSAGRP